MSLKPKGKSMSLKKSKWASKPKREKANPWREVKISEDILISALEYAFRMTTTIKPSERIERVLVGEPYNGIYPLSVAIKNGKEEEA